MSISSCVMSFMGIALYESLYVTAFYVTRESQDSLT